MKGHLQVRSTKVIAHGERHVAVEVDLVVVVDAARPALAAVDGEARVLRVAVLDGGA